MKSFAPFVCLVGIVLIGCGDHKAEEAVRRIQSQKSPGYIRVVNLSADGIEFWYKARPITTTVPTMEATELLPLGTGDQTVRFEYGGKKQEVKTKLTTGIGTSIILMPDLTTKIIENEQRYATTESNVHVVPIDAGGKMPVTAAFSGADTKTLPIKDSLILLNQGNITCPDGSSIEIKERIAYSLFIVATPRKVYYILGKNASDRKPAAAGTSAA